jgi:hypothetical protein
MALGVFAGIAGAEAAVPPPVQRRPREVASCGASPSAHKSSAADGGVTKRYPPWNC